MSKLERTGRLVIVTYLFLAYALFSPIRLQDYMAGFRADHYVVFGIWTYCLLDVYSESAKRCILAFVFSGVAAIFSEVVQFWTPNHTPEIMGAVASLNGVSLGALAWTFFRKKNEAA